uniref:ANK_REP_REGION domain-containing protein n=1 Tax=Globodera pallida TaxID=36090 RepID=A0A183CF38_GLOPA
MLPSKENLTAEHLHLELADARKHIEGGTTHKAANILQNLRSKLSSGPINFLSPASLDSERSVLFNDVLDRIVGSHIHEFSRLYNANCERCQISKWLQSASYDAKKCRAVIEEHLDAHLEFQKSRINCERYKERKASSSSFDRPSNMPEEEWASERELANWREECAYMGRVWRIDCARRDLLLARIQTEGNAVGHVSLLRNMVNDLQECSRLARVVKCQQPIKVPAWESASHDGWEGMELPKEAFSSKWVTKSQWDPNGFDNAWFSKTAFATRNNRARAKWDSCSGPISSWTLSNGPVGLAPVKLNKVHRIARSPKASERISPPKHSAPWMTVIKGKAIPLLHGAAANATAYPVGYAPIKRPKSLRGGGSRDRAKRAANKAQMREKRAGKKSWKTNCPQPHSWGSKHNCAYWNTYLQRHGPCALGTNRALFLQSIMMRMVCPLLHVRPKTSTLPKLRKKTACGCLLQAIVQHGNARLLSAILRLP